LNPRTGIRACGVVFISAVAAGFFILLKAADTPAAGGPMMESSMASPAATTNTPPATNAPPAAPQPQPEYMERYGKILTSGDDPAHPLKLAMPFPDVGEIKIPNQDQLVMRDKLETLAALSDDDIRAQLGQWPACSKMKLADEGTLLTRIQQFKERRNKIAQDKAEKLGLWSTLTKDQRDRFEKEYWDKRLKMDRDLAKQFEPIFADRESKMLEELFREFSSTSPVGIAAQAPKPPAPALAQPKPPTTPVVPPSGAPPVTQAKP
jgi:hypothetical protein